MGGGLLLSKQYSRVSGRGKRRGGRGHGQDLFEPVLLERDGLGVREARRAVPAPRVELRAEEVDLSAPRKSINLNHFTDARGRGRASASRCASQEIGWCGQGRRSDRRD